MMTRQEIAAASNDELRLLNQQICDELKTRARTKSREASFALQPGQRASFVSRTGVTIRGTIQSVGPRNSKCVADSGALWTVGNTLLKVEG